MKYDLPKCPEDSFRWTSFSPDKRAAVQSDYLEARVQKIIDAAQAVANDGNAAALPDGFIDNMVERHINFTRAYWAALGRCASTMITGPANFNVRRNEKANKSADNRYNELCRHLDGCLKRIERLAYPHGKEGDPIRANDPEAITKLENRLIALEHAHQVMKRVNVVARAHVGKPSIEALMNAGLSEQAAQGLLTTRDGFVGFHGFSLTNNLAKINATKDRIAALKNSMARGTSETRVGNYLLIIENVEDQRIQLSFTTKPEKDLIATLKKRGFRWAPSRQCWQRHLNSNGRYAAQQVVAWLKEHGLVQ